MKGKKLMFIAVVVLLVILVFSGRELSFFEISGTKPEDVISAEVLGYGKKVSILENGQVWELVSTLNGIGFSPTLQSGVGIPGGASVQLKLIFSDRRIETVTLPYYSYGGRSFVASAETIRLFDEWFD